MPNIKITRLHGEYVLHHIEGERHAEVQDITMMPIAFVYFHSENEPFYIGWEAAVDPETKQKIEYQIFS